MVGNKLTTNGKRWTIPEDTGHISVQGDVVVGASMDRIWTVENGRLAEGDLIDRNGDALYPVLRPGVVAVDEDWLLVGTHGPAKGAALFARSRDGLVLVQSWTLPGKPYDTEGAFLIDGAAWTVTTSTLVRAGKEGTETFSW